MKCFCEIDYNLVTSIFSLIVAIYAIIYAIRYQLISLLNAQLSDKAKECNNNLMADNMSKIPTENDKISGIISSIITAEEILNYNVYKVRKNILWKINDQILIDQFYLQLHTTIREFLMKENIEIEDIENANHLTTFQAQFKRSKEFLSESLKKNKEKTFEELHRYSLKRNKKK